MEIVRFARIWAEQHDQDLTGKASAIAGTFWKDGKKSAIPESVQEDIITHTKGEMVESILRYYQPGKSTATPLTYGSKAGEAFARKATAEYFAQKANVLSLDSEIKGGKPGSRKITYADTCTDDSSLMPVNYRGARRIRTNADLSFIRELMGGGIDWRIFSLRWKYAISDEELARELGWTIGKLRWHLKGYEKRYARLLGVKRPNGSDRPFGRYTKVR